MLFGRKDHRLSVLPGILSAVLPAAIILLSLLATAVDAAVLPQTADISASAAGSSGSAGGWEVSHTAQLPVSVLTAISCPATGNCVAVGQGSSGNAIAAVTSNGGLDWTLQQLPSEVGSLAGISCPTTQACFAVGQASEPYSSITSGGIVVSTSDGGSSWSVQDIPGGVASLTGISCAISSDCWAVGNNTASVPVMLSTADGGTTWTATAPPAPAGNLYAISCSTTTSCVATGAGGTVVFTSDGGKTWTAPPVPDDTVNLDSVSCADAMFCMAVSAPPYFNNLPLSNGTSRMSRISGISRASVSSPVDTFAGSTSATGSSTDMASAPVWVTTDGGATWTTQQPLASIVGLAGVSCVPTSSTAITGTASTAYTPCTAIGMEVTSGTLDNPITENVVVLASTDGGSIWNTEDTSSSTVNLLAISCNNSTDCITVGAESPNTSTTLLPPLLGTSEIGIALSTTDGGSAWNLTDVPTTSQVTFSYQQAASYTSGIASSFTPVNPYRIADTRSGSGEPYAGQTIAPHGVLTVKVGGTTPLGNTNSGAGVPITATAVVLNVTVATSDASGYLTVWPAGLARPLASSINYGNIDSGNGTIIASQVIVPLGSGGGISIYNPSGYTNVVVDVEGWF